MVLEERTINNISIYPSPINNELQVEFLAGITSEVRITDIYGRILVQEKSDSGKMIFNTSAFEKGIYFVSIEQEGQVYVQKVIRE